MGAGSRTAEELRALVAEAEEGVGALLAALGWSAADVLDYAAADKTLVPCKVAGVRHSVPATAISKHSIRCQLVARGISPQQIEARPPSAAFLYHDAPGVVSTVRPPPLVHATALATAPSDTNSQLVSAREDEAIILLPAPPISRQRAQQAAERWRAIPRQYLLCASIANISIVQLTGWVADICAELSLPVATPELYRYVRDVCIWFAHKRYHPPDDVATTEAVYSLERGMRILINDNVGSKARVFVLALWRRFALANCGYDIRAKAARDTLLEKTAINADEETSLPTAQPDPAVYVKAMMERIEVEQHFLERLQPQAMPVTRCQEHEAFSAHAQVVRASRLDYNPVPEFDSFARLEQRDMAERQKSKLDRLAEMRDYKRRRQRHRKAGVTRKTPTEVLRTIVGDRMHELELLAGGIPSARHQDLIDVNEQPERSPTTSTQPSESGWLHRGNGIDGSRESHRSKTTADERHGEQFGSCDTAHKESKSSHKRGEHREHKQDRLSGKKEAPDADNAKRRRKHDHNSDRQAREDDDERRRRTRYDRHDGNNDVDERRRRSRHRDRSRGVNSLRSNSKEVDASDRWQP